MTADNGADVRGIQDVAKELGVTQRTLRFYEDKGLIAPKRVGSTRVYSRQEVGRIRLILRGKHLGFSIREISTFLDLYDADPGHIEQTKRLLGRVRERLADLAIQHIAIKETIDELKAIERESLDWIEQQEKDSGASKGANS